MRTVVKTWLETSALPVAEVRYLKPPVLPYIVFLEADSVTGADYLNGVSTRQVTVEMYSQNIDRIAEKKIEDLLTAISYSKSRYWIETELFFQTVYDFELKETI